jgi:two-component system nitrogen regulation response regulator GlnG
MLPAEVPALDALLGRDPGLLAVLHRTVRIAPTRASVLVMGETGTGKEMFARVLHELGPRPRGPYVAVNCGALSSELAESELFGHERGAFTGAINRRTGWFEEACGGTLVLDEVGELPVALQPKLLRVLESGRLRRVGGRGEIPVEVRVIALTLRDLHREAHGGSFRLDLYHRLSGFQLWLPPLRCRRGDIVPLAQNFLDEIVTEVGARVLTPEAQAHLLAYEWPGNVRELRNVIRRAAFLSDHLIDVGALEIDVSTDQVDQDGRQHGAGRPGAESEDVGELRPDDPDVLALGGRSFRELEREILGWALRRHGGSRRRAARALGISRSTFIERVRRFNL